VLEKARRGLAGTPHCDPVETTVLRPREYHRVTRWRAISGQTTTKARSAFHRSWGQAGRPALQRHSTPFKSALKSKPSTD